MYSAKITTPLSHLVGDTVSSKKTTIVLNK